MEDRKGVPGEGGGEGRRQVDQETKKVDLKHPDPIDIGIFYVKEEHIILYIYLNPFFRIVFFFFYIAISSALRLFFLTKTNSSALPIPIHFHNGDRIDFVIFIIKTNRSVFILKNLFGYLIIVDKFFKELFSNFRGFFCTQPCVFYF